MLPAPASTNPPTSPFIVDLGCGDNKVPGAYGVDFRSFPDVVDLVADVSQITPEQLPQPADVVIARHVLEHFPVRESVALLTRWTRLLKPGGLLHIEVPRMDFVARHWFDRPGDVNWQYWLLDMAYGGQDYPGNFHQTLYSPELLTHQLQAVGLADITVRRVTQVAVGTAQRPLLWTPPASTAIVVPHYPVTWSE